METRNKKGFTLVELVLSVTLLSIVLIFMMAMLVDLKDKEKSNGADAKLLVNQAIISNTINTDIIKYGLESVSACASMNCFILSFGDGNEKTLKLMSDNQTIFYGNERSTDFIRTLPNGRKYSSIHYYIYANLEIIRISVGKVYKNEDYDAEIYNYMGNKTTDTGGYAASGLILHYDGINNSATGAHNMYSSQWMDLSGNGNNGLLQNIALTPTASSGWIENGLVMDGTDDGIFVDDQLKDLFKKSSTIEFTFSKGALANRDVLFSNCSTASNCNNIEIDASNKNKISINNGAYSGTTSAAVVSNDNITTLSYMFDKSTGVITTYIDGLKGETFTTSEVQNYSYDFTDLWLGRDSTTGASFKGILYSVRVYSYALSDTKIFSNALIDKARFKKQFHFTANDPFGSQVFQVTQSGLYKFELWGARGGNIGSYHGGYGAYTAGTIELTQGDNIYMYIGSAGSDSTINGGNNGGGSILSGQEAYGRGGGGATDIRILNTAWNDSAGLNSRIMVAAGGGGANYRGENYGEGNGGAGGGITGYDGESTKNTNGYGYAIGTGATQTSGGYYKSTAGNTMTAQNVLTGKWGRGGSNGDGGINAQSAGGSGYYGGGLSSHGGGGGGSSFISGHTGCAAVSAEYDVNPKVGCESGGTKKSCSEHYSRKVFYDTKMIDGNGYLWTNVIGVQEVMPNPAGGFFTAGTGNNGSGYIRITYVGQAE